VALALVVVLSALGQFRPVAAVNGGCADVPSGLVSWWTGDATVADLWGTNDGGTYTGAAYQSPAQVLQGFFFDGVDDVFSIPDSASLRPSAVTGFSLDMWINIAALPANGQTMNIVSKKETGGRSSYQLDISDPSNPAVGPRLVFTLVGDAGPIAVRWRIAEDITTGLHHIAFTYKRDADGAGGVGANDTQMYLDGVVKTTETGGKPDFSAYANTFDILYSAEPVRFGTADATLGFVPFSGWIDEIELFSGVLSPTAVAAIHGAGSAGKCKTTQLEVRKLLWPFSDRNRFNLWIDGEKEASNVGNGGTTGEVEVEPGTHSVKETGSSLSRYFISMTCRDEDGIGDVVFYGIGPGPHMVPVEGGEVVVCVLMNRRKPAS
jgi:hypothetical protein